MKQQTIQNTCEKNIFSLPRINVQNRQLYDLEILLVGGFDPLEGFMNQGDYESVVKTMRMSDGTLFPIPIVLDVPESFTHQIGEKVLICDLNKNPLAVLTIESIFTPDKSRESLCVYDTDDQTHPGVHYLLNKMHNRYVGGKVEPVNFPSHQDFKDLRKTPSELKSHFAQKGLSKVIGFQTRNPMHRAHYELIKRACEKIGAPVLVHPVVGMTKPGDIDYVSRVHTYTTVCDIYAKDFTYLSLLPLAMRMAGPREALWHALIRKNYGCTHFIVGRDHAGPGKNSDGEPFYSPYEARDLLLEYAEEIGIVAVPSDELVFSKRKSRYISIDELEDEDEVLSISGTEFRRMLNAGEDIPEWFSFPEVVSMLKKG